MEVANVLTYLHTGFSRPIMFSGIHPSVILLDENYDVKLFDFSLSESIPEGKTHIITGKTGWGLSIVAPELASIVNEKSEVFSFGVLLVMLLTGKSIYSFEIGDCYSLLDNVKKYYQIGRFSKIADPIIIVGCPEIDQQQKLHDFTGIALKCVYKSPGDRTTMIDAAKQLKQMNRSAS
ncbi:hypothetical protein LWI28_016465 [Acer negundo]|uniref:Protein kinase domain-containing protein n=1 Tax=Acer negundo TaxID=4023 RepID=A0AAD5J9V0_ACENE|nr:hypothetical protein LWI28_016465 [Acer negundo]